MTESPGRLWALIEEWRDTFDFKPPSQNEIAAKLGVSPSALSDYKYARHMPAPEFVEDLARLIRTPHERVLDAVLHDNGYRRDLRQKRGVS